jgi:GxxExxY protein
MPFDDEILGYEEPDDEMNALTQQVIGAAIEIHKELGPGLDESMYHNAMCIELQRRSIPFVKELIVDVKYKGEMIGQRRIDLVVASRLVVELKTVEELSKVHKAQVHTYLKITGLKLDLLINFNVAYLKDGLKRIIRN